MRRRSHSACMAPPSRLRRAYAPSSKLKVFYTGGAARLSNDGQLLACACGDDVSIVAASGGVVQRTFTGDSEPITAICFRQVEGPTRAVRKQSAANANNSRHANVVFFSRIISRSSRYDSS